MINMFEALPDQEDVWFHGAEGSAPSTIASGQFFWLSRDPKMASGYANGKDMGSVTPYTVLRANPVNLDRAEMDMTPSQIVARVTKQVNLASINKNVAKQEINKFKEVTQNYKSPQPLYYYWYKNPTVAKQFARMILACGFDSVVVNEEGYETLGVLDSSIIKPALGEMKMRDIMDMLAEMEEEEIAESTDDGVDQFASDAAEDVKSSVSDGVDEFSKDATSQVNGELEEGIVGSIAGGIAGATVGQPKLGATLGSMAQDAFTSDDEPVEEGIAGSIAGGVAGAAVGQPMLGASLGSMAQDAMFDEEEDVDGFQMGMDDDDMELAIIARNAGLDGVEEDALLQKPDEVTHIAGDDVPDTSGLGVSNGMIMISPEELVDEGEHVEQAVSDPVDDWYNMFDLGEPQPEVVDEAPEQPEQHTEPEQHGEQSKVRDASGMKVLGKYHSGSGHTVDLMSNPEGTEFALGTNGKASHGMSGRMMGDMLFAPDQVPSAAVASAIIDAMTDQGFRILMDTSHADVVRDVMGSDQYMVNIIVDGEDHGAANPAKIAEYMKKSPAIFENTKFIVSK